MRRMQIGMALRMQLGAMALLVMLAGAIVALHPGAAAADSATVQPIARDASVAAPTCAWAVPWDEVASTTSAVSHLNIIGDISPFWFDLRASGSRIGTIEGAGDATLRAAFSADGHRVIPTISNHFDGRRVHIMLATRSTRASHATALAALVLARGYDGIDIDYENLRASDRGRFTAFVRTLAATLHADGKVLSVTLMARTADVAYASAQAEDYAAIGAAADSIRVMAYDRHWAGGSAGPVAPIGWVREVATYAASQVNPAKIQLGVPLYGYVWTKGTPLAKAVTWRAAMRLARRRHATVKFSMRAKEPYAVWRARRTGRRSTMWFENGRAIAAKRALATERGLGGVCMWRLGNEDPAVWTALAPVPV